MITDLQQLSRKLHLALIDRSSSSNFGNFPLLVPASFVLRIKIRDINDPLLLQVLPQKREQRNVQGFNIDPLEERKYSPVPGLIHKYYGRVLLLVTNACAINCRFCFRRHLHEKIIDWSKIFSYIKSDATISEVILSGGDPLMLQHKELQHIMDQIAVISHIKRIRIHTRVPIVMPEKITAKLFRAKLPLVFVVHCNHPQEINLAVKGACDLLRKPAVAIFNQTVLLRNVNDNAKTLIALNEKLFDIGVIPYYLHILDKVKGAAHFYVGIEKAKRIYREMQKKLPGYLLPKLVYDFSKSIGGTLKRAP